MKRLERSFFERNPEIVARELIGKLLVSTIDNTYVSGIIVETEAYGHTDDAASHAARGQTTRNASMFGPVGHAYVYRSYGVHFCFNIVSHAKHQKAGGVLIRGVLPQTGKEIICQRRAIKDFRLWCNGPGKLTVAYGITSEHNATDLVTSPVLFVLDAPALPIGAIKATPRIGISRNKDILWRFIARHS